MIRAVLFDLDGTLLPIDTSAFVGAYVRLLTEWFAPRVPRDRFASSLLRATQAMMANRDGTRTNKEVFDRVFYPAIGLTAEVLAAPLADFYAQSYPTLRSMASPDPAARQAVSIALDRGLAAVIATQPIFPEVAIRQRMVWAGLADLPFALVTSYENSHFCKPHPEYFQEVAAAISVDARECLFVGNDGIEDVVANQVGIETYVVTDYLTDGNHVQAGPDRIGSLGDLPGFLSGL